MIPPITVGHPLRVPSWHRAMATGDHNDTCRFLHGKTSKGIHNLFALHADALTREQLLADLETASVKLLDEFIAEGYEERSVPPFSLQRAFNRLRADLADAIRTPPGSPTLSQGIEELRWNAGAIALPGAGILLQTPDVGDYQQSGRPAHLVHFFCRREERFCSLGAALELMPQKRDQLLAAYLIQLDVVGSLAYQPDPEDEAGPDTPLERSIAEWAIREMIGELFLAARLTRMP